MSDIALPDLETGPQTHAPGGPEPGAPRQPSSGGDAAQEHDTTCANCGATLQGPYCHACGQHAHVPRTVLHVFEEVLHGITHFDGRLMRSLPMLLFRPGTLTHRYIHGLRARYVPPFAMFLFSVFTMFLVFAFTGGPGFVRLNEDAVAVTGAAADGTGGDAGVTVTAATSAVPDPVATAREGVAALEAELSAAQQQGDRAAQAAINAALVMARDAEAVAVREQAAAQAGADDGSGPTTSTRRTWLDALKDSMKSGEISVSTPWPDFNKKMQAKFANPDLLFYKLQNTVYKFSFLLIPISLPFLWLMLFWRRGVTLYDHAVFALYSLSFMTLLLIVSSLLARFVPDGLPGTEFLGLLPVLHLFFQFKGTYELGWFGAAWRTALFSTIFAWVSLGLFLAAVVALGVID